MGGYLLLVSTAASLVRWSATDVALLDVCSPNLLLPHHHPLQEPRNSRNGHQRSRPSIRQSSSPFLLHQVLTCFVVPCQHLHRSLVSLLDPPLLPRFGNLPPRWRLLHAHRLDDHAPLPHYIQSSSQLAVCALARANALPLPGGPCSMAKRFDCS
jgi:hypothetical protein